MLDTIPYIFFFALHADEKGVFICIYRIKERVKLGGERAVLQILPTQRYAARAELVYNTVFSARRADGKGMLDPIPYIFFFALRADGKSVFLCIYRPGCFRTVRRRSEGNWQENRLLYSKYLTLQYILMRSRNRERDLAYVAWKGGAWGIGMRKGCFQINSRILHNVAERPFVACYLKLRLFPPVASTNVLLSGLRAQHNYQTSTFS